MRLALIRGNIVENVIKATREFAESLGYDAVVESQIAAPGDTWNGGDSFTKAPPDPAVENTRTIEQTAEDALANLRAYAQLQSPTNAQTIAVVKLLCRVVIGLVRLRLNKLDAAE